MPVLSSAQQPSSGQAVLVGKGLAQVAAPLVCRLNQQLNLDTSASRQVGKGPTLAVAAHHVADTYLAQVAGVVYRPDTDLTQADVYDLLAPDHTLPTLAVAALRSALRTSAAQAAGGW